MNAAAIASTLHITTPSDRELRIERSFNAPVKLVWDCHTKPDLVRRWMLGPTHTTMPVCDIDLSVGGKYRYEWTYTDGRRLGLGGSFREIAPHTRIVHTELFDQDWTGGETVVTMTFDEARGKTNMTMTILYSSKAARDRAVESPMTEGMEGAYAHLDDILKQEAQ